MDVIILDWIKSLLVKRSEVKATPVSVLSMINTGSELLKQNIT